MNRHEVLGQLAVFVVLLVSVTGSTLVLTTKGGRGYVMALVDGAFPGGVIAVCGAAAFIVLAGLLRERDTLGMQLVCSVLLVPLHVLSLFVLHGRVAAGQPSNGSVEWGATGYVVAIGLQVLAVVIGTIRIRRMPADSPRARLSTPARSTRRQ